MSVYNALVVLNSGKVQNVRSELERVGYYDNTRRITTLFENQSKFVIPLTDLGATQLSELFEGDGVVGGTTSEELKMVSELFAVSECTLTRVENLPESKKTLSRRQKESDHLLNALRSRLLEIEELHGSDFSQLLKEIPQTWEKHGDLAVLPKTSFVSPLWQTLGWDQVWSTVARSLRCRRVAVDGRVTSDGFRSSSTGLMLGEDGWVEHIDNGVKYVFDVTKCMFSSGNISEKIRVANLDCSGETVVDLYAGIGYFTLPFLVHAKAGVVHACEWNPNAVEALRRGLTANGVADRCVVHFGDNRKVAPRKLADRVNLGLVPSSESGWPVACAALRPDTGGWLHVHGNVCTKPDTPALFTEGNPWELSEKRSSSPKGETSEPGGELCALSSRQRLVPVEERSEDMKAFLGKPSVEDGGSYRLLPVWCRWGVYVAGRLRELLAKENPLPSGQEWAVDVKHVEHVKSYAPHVDHLVADIECRPVTRS